MAKKKKSNKSLSLNEAIGAEAFINNEKIELMKYILTESSKKLKSELRNNDEYFKGIERWGLI